jgi:hypothetical protein
MKRRDFIKRGKRVFGGDVFFDLEQVVSRTCRPFKPLFCASAHGALLPVCSKVLRG